MNEFGALANLSNSGCDADENVPPAKRQRIFASNTQELKFGSLAAARQNYFYR